MPVREIVKAAEGRAAGVNTISDLRSLAAGYRQGQIEVYGYYAAGDGGGQHFRWSTMTAKAFTAVAATDIFTSNGHGYVVGQPVTLYGGSLPTGVATATTYYITAVTTNTFKLASTFENAWAVTPTVVNITADGSGSINLADNGGSVIVPTGNPADGRWITTNNEYINFLCFGCKADGVQDEATYMRNAIQDAEIRNIGEVRAPYGATGTYLHTTPLVQSRQLRTGISFIATGTRVARDNTEPGVKFLYTGSTHAWHILGNLGLDAPGRWTWRNLTFQCTNGAAHYFHFNDLTVTQTDTITTPNFLAQVRFEDCTFFGAGAGATQTGNGIQGQALFELTIDDTCWFVNWGRGVWLKGCDNCTVGGRYGGNVRSIMLESSGTFGNKAVVKATTSLQNNTLAAESSAGIWEQAQFTTIHPCFFENASESMLYLNGLCTLVLQPFFGSIGNTAPNNVCMRVGPNAQEVMIIKPEQTAPEGISIFDDPLTWDWNTGGEQLFQVICYHPSTRTEVGPFAPHPRMKVISERTTLPEMLASTALETSGESIQRLVLTPFNLSRGLSIGGFNYITAPVADTNGFLNYACQIGTDNRSMTAYFIVGRDINNGQSVRTTIRYRNAATPGTGTFRYVVQREAGGLANGALPVSTTYATYSFSHTISGASDGDLYTFGVYNTSDQNAFVSSILCEVDPTSSQSVSILPALGTDSAAATNLAASAFNAVSDPDLRMMVDFRKVKTFRILGKIGGTLVAATKLRVQYHTGGDIAVTSGDAGWATLGDSAGSHTLGTLFYTADLTIPDAAKINHLLIRVGLFDGNGVADPTISFCQLNVW